jgi:hypothetical protein
MGRLAIEEGRSDIYSEFFVALRKTKAERAKRLIKKIEAAGDEPKHWMANAWLLERADPKRFSGQFRARVEEELGAAIKRLRAAFATRPEILEEALVAISGGYSGEGVGDPEEGEGSEDDSECEEVSSALPESETGDLPRP